MKVPISVPSIYLNIISDVNSFQDVHNVTENFFKVIIVPYLTEDIKTESFKSSYDSYISLKNDNGELPKLDSYKGWFLIKDLNSILGFLNSKIKNRKLYELEGIKINFKPRKKVSIICSYKQNEKLLKSIEILINQSISKKDYEIVIVNNNYENNEIKNFIKRNQNLPKNFIREVLAPKNGLYYGWNIGIWEAEGELLIFLNDNSEIDYDLIKKTCKRFADTSEEKIIGDEIVLKTQKNPTEILTLRKKDLLSINGFKDIK